MDTLRDLSRQDFASFECLVVLQTRPSADELDALMSALPDRLRVYLVDEPNASLARNIGLLEAAHAIVLFLDDDVRIDDPAFLEKHVRNFHDPKLSGVFGQVLAPNEEPTYAPDPAVIEAPGGWARLPANYARRCRVHSGRSNNLAVRRDWAIAVGGMDANFTKGARREETEFNLRYTKRYGHLVFDPEASLVHLSGDGGSRAWGHVRRIVPMHHIIGHWYFLLATIRNGVISPREIVLELRYIGIALLRNPKTGTDIIALSRNVARALWGLVLATRRLLTGPRRIDTLPPGTFEHLTERLSNQHVPDLQAPGAP